MQPDAETGLAPTQLGQVIPTEAHTAWALDPDEPEPPSRRGVVVAAVAASLLLMGGAGGLAVWQLEEPAPVEPVVVAVTPEPVAPVAQPESPPVAAPTTVTVTPTPVTVTAAPTVVPKTPQVSPELDRRFLASLRAKGWVIWDEGAVIWRGRQVCAQFQQHASMNQIMAGIAADAAAEGNPNPYLTAEQLAYTALEVYPACERR